MMRCHDCCKTSRRGPLAECSVACRSCPFLQRWSSLEVELQHGVPDASNLSNPSDVSSFLGALRPKAMIDGCHLERTWQHGVSQEKQGQTIRAA